MAGEKREKTLMCRVTPSFYEEVKQYSEKKGVPVSFVLRKALEIWVRGKDFWEETEEQSS